MSGIVDTTNTYLHTNYHRLKDYLNRKKVNTGNDVQKYIDEVRKNGFALVPNYYSPEECAAARDEIERLITELDETLSRPQGNDADLRLFGCEKSSEVIRKYYEDPFLWDLCRTYHGTSIMNMTTLAARAMGIPGNQGSGNGWHRDSVHIKQFKTLLYLSDVDDQHGPYQYLKGSHETPTLMKLVKDGLAKYNQFRYTPEEVDRILKTGAFELVTVTAPAGTLLMTDTRGIHRGSPLKEGTRYAFTNYFYAAHHASARLKQRFADLSAVK